VITVTSPANGATVTVPFDVHFTYSATDTYTKLWIDGVTIISDHNGSTFDYTVTSLAAGSHVLTLQAHDASSNTIISVHETITVSSIPPTTVTVTPSSQTMLEGTQFTFSSNVSANWSVSGDGGIPTCSSTTSCVFTAGTSAGTATLTATATDGSGATGTALISIAALAISPSAPSVAEGQTQTFTANATVNWGATGDGSFLTACTNTTSCVFTAGTSTGTATITATETSPAALSTSAIVNVTGTASAGSTAVLTSHNDQVRSGANTTEVLLNTTNVNQNQFGLKYSYAVDGQIYAQPLYMPNVPIDGGTTHNVVFVATENDTVYAFDADGLSPSALWSRSLGKPHSVSGSSTGTPIYPSVGITGTPVIDPNTNTMYVFAVTTSGYTLSALDITTGLDRANSPVTVTASVKGTGTGSSKGVLSLPKGCYQRPGLALASGNVYIGFSYCHQGWLLAYDESRAVPE